MDKRVPVGKLAFVSFLSQFAIVKFNFTLVYYLRELGFSSGDIGIATSIYPIVYLLGCLFLPSVAKSVNRKMRIILSLLGMALSVVLFSLVKERWAIYLVLFLYGFWQSLLWTNMETWITTPGGENRNLTKTLTLFNLSWSSSVGMSNLIGGILVSVSYTLSFAVEAAVFLIASALVISAYYKGDEEKTEEKTEDGDEPLSPYRFLSWLGIFIIYTGYSMVIVVFPQYGLDFLGFSSSVSGRLLFLRGVSVCIAFLILRKYTFWQKGKGAIVFMLASFTALTYMFNMVRSEALLSIIFVVYGFIFALGYDLSIFHSAEGGGKRHTRMVIHEVLITAGTTFGSFTGSLVYEYLSFSSLVTSVTAIGGIAFVLSLISGRKGNCR